MAKKKHHTKGLVRRRRHHTRPAKGMFGAIDTTNLLGTAIGALGAKFLNKVIPDTIDSRIVAGGKIALGVVMPMLSKDGKTKNMLQGVGNGFVAVGAIELVEGFGVTLQGLENGDERVLAVALEGIEDVEFEEISSNVLGEDILGMDDDLNVVNGDEDLSVVNSYFDEDF